MDSKIDDLRALKIPIENVPQNLIGMNDLNARKQRQNAMEVACQTLKNSLATTDT